MGNGWRLAKASWRVLARDRELVGIPIVMGFAAVVAFAIVGVPAGFLLGDASATQWAGYILLAIAAILATWVTVIGQAAVMSGAAQRMDGEDPTLGTAFGGARGRSGRLLEWAVLATVVALVVDVIRRRFGIAGQLIASLGNMAFSVLSYLALPVIVFEDVGAIDGFKRSSQLLRGTWGEQLTFSFGLGLIGLVASLPGAGLVVLGAASGVAAVAAVAVTIGVLWIVVVAAVTSALSAVFKVALYRYARREAVDPEFRPSDLTNAFTPRGGR